MFTGPVALILFVLMLVLATAGLDSDVESPNGCLFFSGAALTLVIILMLLFG